MCGDTSTARDRPATVLDNRPIAPDHWRMRLGVAAMVHAPGQFFQLRVRPDVWAAPLLRRPFAPSRTHDDGFSFVYAVVGEGTRLMAALAPGAGVEVLGPLGRGWQLPPDDGDKTSASALVVGGGAGAPSLASLVSALARRGVATHVVLGARTADLLLEPEDLTRGARSFTAATLDGSEGFAGHAVAAAAARLDAWSGPPPTLYGCGPAPMLKALAALAAERSLACQVSLEGRMACGFGACMGCAVAVADGDDDSRYVRVCVEGPVFDAATLRWS